MTLSAAEVNQIAHLARLGIDNHDIGAYAEDLSALLALMAQMEALDTQGVEPMAHPLGQTQRLRADEVTETDQQEHFQAIAPLVEEGLYLVPKVIE